MFFFFKQKTAYEMRISDWSSDVCSSDLHAVGLRILLATYHPAVDDRAAALKADSVLGFTNDRAAIYNSRIDSQIFGLPRRGIKMRHRDNAEATARNDAAIVDYRVRLLKDDAAGVIAADRSVVFDFDRARLGIDARVVALDG